MNLHPVNRQPAMSRRKSTCPHDCPSTCALDVEVLDGAMIGRVRGSDAQSYTAGVICAKVARYAERVHHPGRLTQPLKRVGAKGEGRFEPISWDEALDIVAEKFAAAEAAYGTEAVWPYYYAGTMGLVQRDGIHRLRHVKRYSGQHDTICSMVSSTAFIAGTGRLAGPDPREMAKSDCVVIWGTNAAATQVNVLTHAIRARKDHGAKIVAIDIYRTPTLEQADLPLILKPGTDGALACAVMHVLFRDGLADRDYLARYTDAPDELEAHVKTRSPQWAAEITGLSIAEIEEFAALVGNTPKTYFRLGFGFTRQRNGAVAMHAAASIAAVTGAWKNEGGGAFHSNGGIFNIDNTVVIGANAIDPAIRRLDQSRIGEILTGESEALLGGPPVTAMIVQNTNPMTVAPDQAKVQAGFMRDDLFVCVHEQFMTETAQVADIVLPATMFLEHDDIYRGGGHQYLLLGPKLIEPPGECRSNHEVLCALADRLGAEHRGFTVTAREHIDLMLQNSGYGSLAEIERDKWIDCQPDFETAHYLNGFA
ncbi:MAG: molybdopterin-dependent oxidoreductase, partial [Hyphomicrobiales bacterium]|nr:molybdopterin-dependent oxidoreductase [Hyphomicrobiales bacterium]